MSLRTQPKAPTLPGPESWSVGKRGNGDFSIVSTHNSNPRSQVTPKAICSARARR